MRKKVAKEEIIEKGLEIMLLKGYEGTGIQEIAESVNILKGSFYNYFSSKEDFTNALINSYAEKSLNFSTSVLTDQSFTPIERIKKLFVSYWQMLTSKNGYSGGCFLGNCSQEIGNTNEILSKSVDKAFKENVDLLCICLGEAYREKQISNSHDFMTLAEFVLLSWQGVLVRTKSAKSEIAFESFMKLMFEKVLV